MGTGILSSWVYRCCKVTFIYSTFGANPMTTLWPCISAYTRTNQRKVTTLPACKQQSEQPYQMDQIFRKQILSHKYRSCHDAGLSSKHRHRICQRRACSIPERPSVKDGCAVSITWAMQMQLSTLNVDGLYYNCGVHWNTGQRSDARTPANGRHRYERYDNVKPWEIGGV